MIVSVLYKVGAGGKFDVDYYLATHIPLVRTLWGPVGLSSVRVLKGTGTAGGGAAEIDFIALLEFASMAAFEEAAKLHGKEIIGDIVNFTDTNPTIQFNEAIG
jgi:uncharacterized protein (TIGR02118 family)